MDSTVPVWSEERFQSICTDVRELLVSLRFLETSIQFIPVSGLSGVNVCTGSGILPTPPKKKISDAASPIRVCSWYSGPSVLEALDSLNLSSSSHAISAGKPPSEHSLRAVVSSVFDRQAGCEVGVKILRGTLKQGRKLGFLGGAIGTATVHAVYSGDDRQPVDCLAEGEQGSVLLVNRYATLCNVECFCCCFFYSQLLDTYDVWINMQSLD